MLMISLTVAFENITDPNGVEADNVVDMVTSSCHEWALDVGATWVGVDEAWIASRDEMNNVRNISVHRRVE